MTYQQGITIHQQRIQPFFPLLHNFFSNLCIALANINTTYKSYSLQTISYLFFFGLKLFFFLNNLILLGSAFFSTHRKRLMYLGIIFFWVRPSQSPIIKTGDRVCIKKKTGDRVTVE